MEQCQVWQLLEWQQASGSSGCFCPIIVYYTQHLTCIDHSSERDQTREGTSVVITTCLRIREFMNGDEKIIRLVLT